MEEQTPLPSAISDNQIPYQPLKLKKTHLSEGDHIEQEGIYLSTCSLDDSDKEGPQTPSAAKSRLSGNEEITFQNLVSPALNVTEETAEAEDSGRERLKRHRVDVAGRVWIPEMWGQEELLKDWINCSAFDAPFVPSRIMTARAALIEEGRRANAGGLTIQNRC